VAKTKARKTQYLAIKMVPKPSVTIVIETHFQVDIATIEVDNQTVVIQVQVGKNIIEDVTTRNFGFCNYRL
jgi:hypothetical protein